MTPLDLDEGLKAIARENNQKIAALQDALDRKNDLLLAAVQALGDRPGLHPTALELRICKELAVPPASAHEQRRTA